MLFKFKYSTWKPNHSTLRTVIAELEAIHSLALTHGLSSVRADLGTINAFLATNPKARAVRTALIQHLHAHRPELTYLLEYLPAVEPRFRGPSTRERARLHDGVTQVRQGQLGDCWLVATLAACENVKPGFVTSLIEHSPHINSPHTVHTVSVQLHSPWPRTVAVTRWVPRRHRAGDNRLDANNASLVEKAVSSLVHSYVRIQFNFAGTALWLLTGTWCPARPVPSDLGVVREWLASGRPVVASTLVHRRGARRLPREDNPDRWVGVMAGHVYVVCEVLRCDEDGRTDDDAPWRVHVHNPLGGAEGEPRRTDLFLSAAQFKRAFLSVNVGPVV